MVSVSFLFLVRVSVGTGTAWRYAGKEVRTCKVSCAVVTPPPTDRKNCSTSDTSTDMSGVEKMLGILTFLCSILDTRMYPLHILEDPMRIVPKFNAARLVEDCGGVREIARKIGKSRTEPYRWMRTGYMHTRQFEMIKAVFPHLDLNQYFENPYQDDSRAIQKDDI